MCPVNIQNQHYSLLRHKNCKTIESAWCEVAMSNLNNQPRSIIHYTKNMNKVNSLFCLYLQREDGIVQVCINVCLMPTSVKSVIQHFWKFVDLLLEITSRYKYKQSISYLCKITFTRQTEAFLKTAKRTYKIRKSSSNICLKKCGIVN